MKFALIGTPEALRSRRDGGGQAGFSLLEALVSLAVILAFAGVLGPHLSQARRIMADADGRVAAQVLLRSLLDAPFDRSGLASVSADRPNWQAYRVMASVVWGSDQVITAETIRLRRAPGR
jgi:Tfp pilus assembly protein PilV